MAPPAGQQHTIPSRKVTASYSAGTPRALCYRRRARTRYDEWTRRDPTRKQRSECQASNGWAIPGPQSSARVLRASSGPPDCNDMQCVSGREESLSSKTTTRVPCGLSRA